MLHSSMVGRLRSGALEYQWGDARLVFDDPAKIKAARSDRATHLLPQLAPVIEATRAELVLVSPYFVPGDEGVAFLEGLVARGVDVTVLTNSLASNDVLPVYAGYAPYQKRLLAAGVRLWELKPGARPRGREREEATLTEQLKGSASGSSRAALHAKTFVFDRKALFVGSLNLDPRSSTINTEIGALFRNETLAGGIAGTLAGELPGIAYRLELRDGAVRWIERRDGGEIVHDVEPETSFARRAAAKALALLPIEGML
jgi:putative cardiolipin synthase